MDAPKIAIVNLGLGNLFSIQNVCEVVGLNAGITADEKEIRASDGIIFPGVGAFGKAMNTLKKLGLIEILKDEIAKGKPFFGICLGLQLLFSDSNEFGFHEGLDVIKGTVRRFEFDLKLNRVKIPLIGWNHIYREDNCVVWNDTVFDGLSDNEYMYFVHSYFVNPKDKDIIFSYTKYNDFKFCSSISKGNIFACQFHPEKSSKAGIKIYSNWAKKVKLSMVNDI